MKSDADPTAQTNERICSGPDVSGSVDYYVVCKNRSVLLTTVLLAFLLACPLACLSGSPESLWQQAEGLSCVPAAPYDSCCLERNSATISEDGLSPRSIFQSATLIKIPESPCPSDSGSLSSEMRVLHFSRLRDARIPARSPPLLSAL